MPTYFGILGDWINLSSIRNIYLCYDINPDLISAKNVFVSTSYITRINVRYIDYKKILYIYNSRWIGLYYKPEPISEKKISIKWCQTFNCEKTIYYYLDESIRYMYCSALITQTPLILKYPKYYSWEKLPRVLTPEFKVWSYYPLDINSIVVKVMSNSGYYKVFTKNLTPNLIEINNEGLIYNIKIQIDNVFNENDEVVLYITAFDVLGNYLKQGLW